MEGASVEEMWGEVPTPGQERVSVGMPGGVVAAMVVVGAEVVMGVVAAEAAEVAEAAAVVAAVVAVVAVAGDKRPGQ